jgi:hypothetical protein
LLFERHAPTLLRGAGLPDQDRGRAILPCVTDIIKWHGRESGEQAGRRRGGLARYAENSKYSWRQ